MNEARSLSNTGDPKSGLFLLASELINAGRVDGVWPELLTTPAPESQHTHSISGPRRTALESQIPSSHQEFLLLRPYPMHRDRCMANLHHSGRGCWLQVAEPSLTGCLESTRWSQLAQQSHRSLTCQTLLAAHTVCI